MIKISIPNYDNYELHYSSSEQKVYSKKSEKYLKNNLTPNGYYFVRLYNSEGVKTWCLHRIVWYVFNGEIPENMQVNHLNEDKLDNRIENLNLMTPSQNINYGNRNQKCSEKMIGVHINRQDQSKQVVGINKTNYDIIEFVSSMEAERTDKKFNHGDISKCCKHKISKTVNKYYFFYKSEFDELFEKYQGNIEKIINYKLSRY